MDGDLEPNAEEPMHFPHKLNKTQLLSEIDISPFQTVLTFS